MNTLIVGDVHGCYHTLQKLVHNYWNPETDNLVFVGDLINKGPHSAKCLSYVYTLYKKHKTQVVLVRGNHEQQLINRYNIRSKAKAYLKLCKDLETQGDSVEKIISWLKCSVLSWQNEKLLVTHAGISSKAKDPFNIKDANSVISNRKSLRRLQKVQVVGHSVIRGGKPLHSAKENAWFIDTGAYLGNGLCALYFFNEDEPHVRRIDTLALDKW